MCVCDGGGAVGGVPPVHRLAGIPGIYFEQRGTIFSFRQREMSPDVVTVPLGDRITSGFPLSAAKLSQTPYICLKETINELFS